MCHHSARKGNIRRSWGSLATALSQWALGSQKALSQNNKVDSNKVRYLKLTFGFYTHAPVHKPAHPRAQTSTHTDKVYQSVLASFMYVTARINWE